MTPAPTLPAEPGAAPLPHPPTLRGFLRASGWVLAVFVLSRLLVIGVILLSKLIVGRGPYWHPGGLLDMLAQWDGVWYLHIARHGYFFTPETRGTVAFFPTYPLLVRLLAVVFADFRLAAVLVSHLCLLGAGLLLRTLIAEDDPDPRAGRAAVALLMFSPVSFFFSSAYTESTFMLLAVGAFLALLKTPDADNAMRLEELLMQLATDADRQRVIATLRSVPLIATMLTDRYLRPAVSLNELSALPLGTLGRGYYEYTTKYNLSQDFHPKIAPADDLLYFRLRMYQIHDILHVLSGYQADYVGEMAILGFTLGQLARYLNDKADVMVFSTLLSCAMFLHAALFANQSLTTFLAVFTEGWQRGQAADQLLDVHWEKMWERPLHELQEQFHIASSVTYLSYQSTGTAPSR